MRGSAILILFAAACSGGGNADEQAKKQANELEHKAGSPAPAEKQHAPVPNEQHVPCDQLINVAAFQTALGEKDPITIGDVTQTDAEAAASCSLIKGGKKLTAKEQEALAKKNGDRMGLIAGDPICRVTAYCWTVEDDDHFKKRCAQIGREDDDTMGSYACTQTVVTGADDVKNFRFLDEDTKCVIEVHGGPSNTDNDKILTCAKTARDSIGPDQIKVIAVSPSP